MANRVVYKGTGIFLNGEPAYRVNAFGSTTALSREDIFEMGNADLVEIIDDIPTVDINLESNEHGSKRVLGLLSNEGVSPTKIDFAETFDNAKVDIFTTIESEGESWVQVIKDAFVSGVSYQFSTDGNFTENYTLVSDDKRLYINDMVLVPVDVPLTAGEGTFDKTTVPGFYKAIAAYASDTLIPLTDLEWENNDPSGSGAVTVGTSNTSDIEAKVICVASADVENKETRLQLKSTESKSQGSAAKRAGHIKVSLGTDSLGYDELQRAQSLGLDVSLDREELKELGNDKVYARPLNLPINIDVSLDMLHADMDFFKKLVDTAEGLPDELDMRKLKKDLKLKVEIYKDPKSERTESVAPIKTFEVTNVVTTDESFSINLDSNATQTFSFRASKLTVE